MLGKLIKYDLKSMSRAFVPMWILAPVISLMLSISIRGMTAWEESPVGNYVVSGGGLVMTVMILLFSAVMIGLTVMTILFIIQRFWNGLLKEEGYLMFTLPVKVWELITAKGVAAALITCVSVMDGILSCFILILASSDELVLEMIGAWNSFKKVVGEFGPMFWVIMVLLVIALIAGLLESIYQVYASMALGQLFEGHRVIGACAAYVGISVAVSVLTSIVMIVVDQVFPDSWIWYTVNGSETVFGITYMLLLILSSAVKIAVFHVITERILSTRLNLE